MSKSDLIASLKAVVSSDVSLSEPLLDQNDIERVADCIRSGYISSISPFVDQFERSLETVVGAGYACSVVNGTAALMLAMRAMGVEPGTEVFVPALTFVATASAVCQLGATPHFLDADLTTLTITSDILSARISEIGRFDNGILVNKISGNRIVGVVPVHIFGHCSNLASVVRLARQYNLFVLEDASEALGSLNQEVHAGLFGDAGVLSFNGNKIISTGGGGAIVTNSETIWRRVKHLSTTAKVQNAPRSIHDEVGYNFRLPGLNAALGCAQLSKLDLIIDQKRFLYKCYRDALAGYREYSILEEPPNSRSNYWLQALQLSEPLSENQYENFVSELNSSGIAARAIWQPLHLNKPYKNFPKGQLMNTLYLSRTLINLPSTRKLSWHY